MSKINVPVNKGNYSIDTPEREALFEKHRGEAWPDGYKKYRKNWQEYPQKRYVSEYPLNLDIELSTICNLKCPMCFTISDEFRKKVPSKFMDFGLFKKIIDEIHGKVPAIRLSFRGESTLHPNFIDAIKYAKDKGIGEVSTLTNGSTITEKFFTNMMLAGIDWITISIDGTDETYEKIRKPLKFKEILEKVKVTKAIKEKYGYYRPVIKIQTIWSAIKNNPGEFYNTFSPYSDLVAFNPDVDFFEFNRIVYDKQQGNGSKIEYIDNFVCSSVYQRFFICSDGKAIACCFDMNGDLIIGDATKESIYEIWHGKNMTEIRNLVSHADGFKKIPICRACINPRVMDDTENAEVNGRSFKVHRYI